ncbi:MAG TPA: anti-sigma factor [Mycobacteriales bacterium]
MTDHDIYPELVVGRVLDALEPGDDALLSSHLERCDACRELLADMRQTAAALAYDVEQIEPPAALLDRIRAALPDPAVVVADTTPAALVPSARHTFGARTLSRRRSGRTRIAVRATTKIAAGIAAAAVLFSGGYAWHARDHSDDMAKTLASDQLVINHLKTGSSYSVGLVSGGAATGTAVVDGRNIDLIADGLGRNDARNSIYVLWAARPGTTKMTAVTGFDVSSDGLTVVHATMPAGLVGPTTFGVTHEAGRTLPATPGQAVLGVRSG